MGRGSSGRLYRAHRHEEVPPWVLLACLCREEEAGKLTELILRTPPPWGSAGQASPAPCAPACTVQTPWGPVTVKETPDGRGKPEYEEAATIARREGLTPK